MLDWDTDMIRMYVCAYGEDAASNDNNCELFSDERDRERTMNKREIYDVNVYTTKTYDKHKWNDDYDVVHHCDDVFNSFYECE